MDVRKSAISSPAGTLRLLKNAHITPGGEIEKRQQFQTFATAPAGTKGLASYLGYVYAFKDGGPGANVAATPTTVGVQGLSFPGGVTIAEVLDWDAFGGLFYTIARGSDGNVYHFWGAALKAAAAGTACRTHRSKMYTLDGGVLRFSAVGAPGDMAGTGSGFIDLSAEDGDMAQAQALEAYYDKVVVMSRRASQVWFLDPDPNKNQLVQTLRQAGTYAYGSLKQYGSGDVLYLSSDGIRSLKARELSTTASVSDIGSPMDPYVKGLFQASYSSMIKARAIIEPISGRYWIVLPTEILVLSNYPSPKISAWCTYTPGFTVTDVAATEAHVYLRANDGTVYRYGGGTGAPVYDSSPVEVEMPFLDFDKPATFKTYQAIDVACTGAWSAYAGINPHDSVAEDLLGSLSGPNFLSGQFAMMGYSTHISLRFRATVAGALTLAKVMIHYREGETT